MIVRALTGAFILLLGLVLLLRAFFTSATGEDWIRRQIEGQLAEVLAQQIKIGSLETDLWGRVHLEEVSIRQKDLPDTSFVFKMKKLDIAYDIWGILQQRFTANAITIDSLLIHIKRGRNGQLHLPFQDFTQEASSGQSGSSWHFHLEQLALTNAQVEYEDLLIPLEGRAYDLNVSVASAESGEYQFQIAADSLCTLFSNERFIAQPLELRGTLTTKILRFDSLFVEVNGLDLTGSMQVDLEAMPRPLQGRLHVRGALQPWAHYLPAPLHSLSGALKLDAAVEGTMDSPRLEMELESTSLRIAALEAPKASARLTWENRTARLEQFHAKLSEGSVDANGELNLDSLLTIRAHWKWEAVSFQKLWQAVMGETLPLAGQVNGELATQGSLFALEQLELSSALWLRHATFNSHPLRDTHATFALQHGKTRVEVQQAQTQIRADADIHARRLRGKIVAEVPVIRAFTSLAGLPDLNGAAAMSGDISGTIDSPVLDMKFAGSNIVFRNLPVDTLTGHLLFQNAQLTILDSYLSGSASKIDTLHPPFNFTGWRGGYHYHGRASGPWDNLQGQLTAELRRPVLMNRAFEHGHLVMHMSDATLFLDTFQLHHDSLCFAATGAYQLSASQIHGQLAISAPFAEGDAATAATQPGDIVTFELNFADSTRLRAALRGTEVDLRFLSLLGDEGAMIRGRGTIDLRGEGSLRDPHLHGQLMIREGNLQLRPGAEPVQNFGLQFIFSDSVLHIEDISGKVGDMPFRVYGVIADMAEQQLLAELHLDLFNTRILNGRGAISPETIDYKLNIDKLNLALFQPFVPALENLGGSLNATLAMRGALSAPVIIGSLAIDSLSFKPSPLTSPWSRGVMRLRFDQNQVHLDSLFLAMPHGYILAAGKLARAQGEPPSAELRLFAKDLNFAEPESYQVEIDSAALIYKAQGGFHRLEGDIALGDSRFTRKIHVADFFSLARNQLTATLQGPSAEPLDLLSFIKKNELITQRIPPALQQTQLRLRLRDSDSLWVQNNIAQLRMEAELQLLGTLIKPSLAGRLSIKEGEVSFLDRVFTVLEGTLDFSDPERANPMIKLEAETKSAALEEVGEEEYLITLNMAGPLDDFECFLTSHPPLEEPDIIALLTLGVTSEHLSSTTAQGARIGAGAALQRRMETLASDQLTGNITDFASRSFGKQIGLDRVGVTGDVFDMNKARFMAAKKFQDRLELKYTTSFKRLNDYEIQANYRLWKYLFLAGQTNQKNESQGDLKFRIKFE